MTLDRVLTAARLRARAGYAFARGEAYQREGRVVAYEEEHDRVVATVVGTARYGVQLIGAGSSLLGDCTCPVDDEFCKHVVALGLHYLATREVPTVRADRARAGFKTQDDVIAWARAHEVSHLLWTDAASLIDAVADADWNPRQWIYMLGNLALLEVGSLDVVDRRVPMPRMADAIVRAAEQRLRDEAAQLQVGIIEEAARPRTPPLPELANLWTQLCALRVEQRRHAPTRSRAARGCGRWTYDRRRAIVVWHEREQRVVVGARWPLETELQFPTGAEGELTCTCRDDAPPDGCVHAIALIDATLDVLEDPARRPEALELAAELMRPRWSRALQELAQLEDATPSRAIEVWWEIERELGTMTLTPVVKKHTKRGALTAGARMSPARLLADHREVLDDRDRRIAEELAAWAPGGRGAPSYPYRAFLTLVGHPRVRTEGGDGAEVRRAALGFQAIAVGDEIRIEPAIEEVRFSPRLLEALSEAFEPGEPLVTIEPDGSCLVIEVSDDARRMMNVLSRHGDTFPPESHGPLLERLAELGGRMPITVPDTLKGAPIAAEHTVVLRVRLLKDVSLEVEAFVRPAPSAPVFTPGAGPRDVMVTIAGHRGYVRRRLGDELAIVRGMLARLPALDDADEGPPLCFQIAEPDVALALVAALQQPPPGLEAEWVDGKVTVGGSVGAKELRVKIDTRRDWFGLAGEATVEEGRIELAVLLDAARRQQRFVRVDAHRWVELTAALRAKLTALADQTYRSRDRLELSPGAVPAVRELIDAGVVVETPPAWDTLTERLLSARRLKPRPPSALGATLRPYQVEGHAWLSRVAAWGAGACLADDMGLGKTIQTIAVLLDRGKRGPAFVLAPTSVVANWVDELRRFAPTLRPVVYGDHADRTAVLPTLGKRDVLIASYGLLVRDAAALQATRFATLVLDEAQAIKNASTHRARVARKLDAEFRIALSGTPLENHLGELWSLFAVVFPGLLGSWDQFRDRFAIPIEKHGDPEARAALARVLQPFLLRRTKHEVARELPARTEILVPVSLSREERALYEDARLAAVAELVDRGAKARDEKQRFAVLAALTRLRLLASHPRLHDARSQVTSSKMARLLELLDDLREGGHRALVFSQFTSHLALVREELDRTRRAYLYLDGGTPAKRRAALIAQFQAGEGDVFLISLKAGGTGINLTAADYVIHLDPWWNPAVEDQATDRAHRIGQTRPVTVYRLVARDTVEEEILEMHGDKRALVSQILDGTDVAARLTTGDLLALLSRGASA